MKSRSLITALIFIVIVVLVLARKPHPQMPATIGAVVTNTSSESMMAVSETANRALQSPAARAENVQARIDEFRSEAEAEIAM